MFKNVLSSGHIVRITIFLPKWHIGGGLNTGLFLSKPQTVSFSISNKLGKSLRRSSMKELNETLISVLFILMENSDQRVNFTTLL